MRNWKQIWINIGIFALLFIFASTYYKQGFTELRSRNAMDIAQVARNLMEEKGYVTRFIRPINTSIADTNSALFPELNHPPLYIIIEAAMFRIRAIAAQSAATTSFLFLLLTSITTYFLAKILFNRRSALLAAALITLSAPIISTGISGEEWSFASFLTSLLLLVIANHHKASIENNQNTMWASVLAAFASAGLYYTNQILFVLFIPVFIYFLLTGERRKLNSSLYLIVFLVLCAPWIYYNTTNTHSPIFGISTWDIAAQTSVFPKDLIYRFTDSNKSSIFWILMFPIKHFMPFLEKIISNSIEFGSALLYMLGFAGFALMIVSSMYRFKNATVNALRGVFYGLIGIAIPTFAAFGLGNGSMIIFAPLAAAIAAEYFLLLLDSKKLHPSFSRMLIAVFLLITMLPSLKVIIWKDNSYLTEKYSKTVSFFTQNSNQMADRIVYTDVPWEMAWRTLGTGCWLPLSDSDVKNLTYKSIPMNLIVLTSECENYSTNEFWFRLYTGEFWRELTTDSEVGFHKYLRYKNAPADKIELFTKFSKRSKRTFSISESVEGFVEQQQDITQPAYIRVFVGG